MNELIQGLTTAFSFPFMQNALLAGCLIGVVCAVLSCFLVLRGWSLMGDAVSHAVLPGIAIAEIVGFAHPIGAFISGLACAILTGFIGENSRLKEDTVMGIVFSGMFAIGILMISQIETSIHLKHVIEGNLLGVTEGELKQIVIITGIVLLIMSLKWRDFLLYNFDPSHARVIGLPTKLLHYTLLVMLAMTIVAAIQAVGVIIIVALLVAPGITGFVLTKNFSIMMIIAIASSLISAISGLLICYYINASPSACIVIVHAILFAIAMLIRNWKIVK